MDRATENVTLLLTDVEGSTRLWEQHPDEIEAAMARHHELVAELVDRFGGWLPVDQGEGDARFAAFPNADQGIRCALELQRAFLAEPWPPSATLRVRMGIHTGQAVRRNGNYFGETVSRCARLRGLGHGSQVLLSKSTLDALTEPLPGSVTVIDLGLHRMKDLRRPERVFQLFHPDLPRDHPPLRSLDQRGHNLPAPVTSFVGRERELAEVGKEVLVSRLVTLTGMGGGGKTRLALQVGLELVRSFPDGVWLIAMASVADPALVPDTAATALGLRTEPPRSPEETIADHLHSRSVLLVLDNCEHLVDAAAELTSVLLARCPHLRVLATSRAALRVRGEVVYEVGPLETPAGDEFTLPEALRDSAAVRLFVDRAQAARPDLDIDLELAASICRKLEGIPLAIELAAARVRSVDLRMMDERLSGTLRLLVSGDRTADPRHQTLRAAIDWSHDLLDEPERVLFRRLGVFAGGFALTQAEDVCAGPGLDAGDVLDLLASLIERSLVRMSDGGRYGLLEIVRQYALEKLTEAGEAEVVRDRHLEAFRSLGEGLKSQLQGPELRAALDVLEAEVDNIRTALDHACGPGETQVGLDLAAYTYELWLARGATAEGLDRVLRLLDRDPGPSIERARALAAAADLADTAFDFAASIRLASEAIEIGRTFGAHELVSWMTSLRAHSHLISTRDAEGAKAMAVEALDLARAHADLVNEAFALNVLGRIGVNSQDPEARSILEEGWAVAAEVGQPDAKAVWQILHAELDIREGRLQEAGDRLREALSLSEEAGDPEGIGYTLQTLARVVHLQGDPKQALSYMTRSLEVWRRTGIRSRQGMALQVMARLTEDPARKEQLLREAEELLQPDPPTSEG